MNATIGNKWSAQRQSNFAQDQDCDPCVDNPSIAGISFSQADERASNSSRSVHGRPSASAAALPCDSSDYGARR
jgi:hypothetical protein